MPAAPAFRQNLKFSTVTPPRASTGIPRDMPLEARPNLLAAGQASLIFSNTGPKTAKSAAVCSGFGYLID